MHSNKTTSIKKIGIAIILLSFFQTIYSSNHQDTKDKYAIFVVGTGRCGSSCLMGILQILGVPIGDNFVKPYPGNPKGNFEHIGVRKNTLKIVEEATSDLRPNDINDSIFYLFFLPLISWEKKLKKPIYINMIKNTLEQTFGQYSMFAFKDPRTSFLLPLYTSAALELGYTPKIIVMLRDPSKVLASFKREVPSKYHDLLNMYLCRNYISILNNIDMHDMLTINFDDLINQTKATVKKLENFIPGIKNYEMVEDKIAQFIDPSFNHHTTVSDNAPEQQKNRGNIKRNMYIKLT